jgi:predicted flavoprotein YhiN
VTDGSPNTLRKIFNTWPLDQVRSFFEVDLGVPLQLEAATGKLFPTAGRARVVLDALLSRAGEMGVRVRTGARVTGLARSPG